MVFLCIAQSDFILFVDYSLYHTTNGDVLQHRKKKRWAASVSDYRCCPLKICFDPLSDSMKESNFLILFVGCALLRLFKILASRVHIEFRVYLKTVNTPKQRVFSTCWAPFFLAIRRVFLQKNGFIRRKIPRRLSYFRFPDRP